MDLRITCLTFSYGRQPIFTDLDLHAPSEKVTVVVGQNGCGKSTLLRAICGILTPHSGQIRLGETDLMRMNPLERARIVAFVPQEHSVAYPVDVDEFVMLGRTPHMGIRPRAVDRARTAEAVDLLDLSELAHRDLRTLSGGQRQRVLIARAVAQGPKLMVLDEPTSALDLRYQVEVMDRLRAFCGEHGMTVLLALHDLDLAARYADCCTLIARGRVTAQGDAWSVFTKDRIQQTFETEVRIVEVDGDPHVVAMGSPGRLPRVPGLSR